MSVSMMKRSFTKREKALLIMLAVVVIAVVYYIFVLEPVCSGVARANAELALVREQVAAQAKVFADKRDMLDEIDREESAGFSQPAQYDNQSEVIKLLDDVLSGVEDYTLSFLQITEENGLVRRPVTLNYTANSYVEAGGVIGKLMDCPFRCDIVSFAISPTGDGMINYGKVSVRVDAVFYEIKDDMT